MFSFLMLIIGIGCIAYGVSMIYQPAALIVVGIWSSIMGVWSLYAIRARLIRQREEVRRNDELDSING